MAEAAISVEAVSKKFRLYHERNQSLKAALMRGRRAQYEDFMALQDVTFDIPTGSTFGLIGENGSGKSTLLKIIAGIYRPNSGSVRTRGSMAALLELGSGFHPELSGRENVYLNGSILGMKKAEITSRFDEIVDFAGIEQFIDQPVKNYSSGMYVRLGFSVAINVDPDILLVDEVLAVGDSAFQEKCMEKFLAFRRAGKTVVIVSHGMDSMRTMCDSAVWLEHGKVVRAGPAAELVDSYIDAAHTSNTVHEAPDGADVQRWGSGEATFESVELLGPQRQPTSAVRTGEQVTFRLRYKANERIEQPVFGLALETLDGTYAWAHHSRDGQVVPDYIEGVGTFELTIDRLMLQPGSFQLLAAISDYTTNHVYDFLRHCVRFDVESGTPRESGGIVALGGTWSATPGGDASPGPFHIDVAGAAALVEAASAAPAVPAAAAPAVSTEFENPREQKAAG
ncbi:MAG: transporter related [Frankiales bacterium]|nr:transporter related [Frankiales bacterium]